MEVRATAETSQPKPAEKAQEQVTSPAKTGEGPRDPSRRRLLTKGLRITGAVAAAELGVAAGLAAWPKVDQFLKTLAPTPTSSPVEAIPTLLPVEPDKPAAEKAINKVPLAPRTIKAGQMDINPFSGTRDTEHPYGFSLGFQDLTIVDVQKNNNGSIWIALGMPDDKLTRLDLNKKINNFDGTTTEAYMYRGFTAWLLVDDSIFVRKGPVGTQYSQGLSSLESNLVVGNTISLEANMNQIDKIYQDMNKTSFDLLEENLGKPNADRSIQTYKFHANFAYLQPINP